MPYISPRTRESLPHRPAVSVGELTYKIQQDLDEFLQGWIERRSQLSFQLLAECLAALDSARADFIKRVLTPYEEHKHHENGEVWSQTVLDHTHGKTRY